MSDIEKLARDLYDAGNLNLALHDVARDGQHDRRRIAEIEKGILLADLRELADGFEAGGSTGQASALRLLIAEHGGDS